MKIKTSNFLLISYLFFLSCSNSEDNINNEKQILGKWYPIEEIYEGKTYEYTGHEDCGRDYYIFKEGGIYNFIDIRNCEERRYQGKYIIEGNKFTKIKSNGARFPGTYEIKNDKLYIYSDYESIQNGVGVGSQLTIVYER